MTKKCIAILLLLVLCLTGCVSTGINDYTRLSHNVHKRVFDALEHSGVLLDYQTKAQYDENVIGQNQWLSLDLEYVIPIRMDWDLFVAKIDKHLSPLNCNVRQLSQAPPVNKLEMDVIEKNLSMVHITIYQKVLGEMAIVIDDLGYNLKAMDMALLIDRPITYAVLPRLAKSKFLAEKFNERGDLIMLHQPMASKKGLDPGAGAIYPKMSKKEIITLIKDNLQSVPHVKGVNNHMGSLITSDEKLMTIVLNFLKQQKIFFLDSITSKSICKKVSKKIGFPIYQRNVFIDNKKNKPYIKGQIDQLIKVTLSRGKGIGIGHFFPITLQCILEKIPEIEAKGIRLVYVNELSRD